MEKSVIYSSKTACNLALGLWSVCAIVFALRVMRYAGIITFNVYMGIDIAPIAWYPDAPEAQIAQWIELAGYVATTIAILWLTLSLIISTRKGIAVNKVFTRPNAKMLTWLSALAFIHLLFTDNLGIIYGSKAISITATPFVCGMVVLIVAMLYRMAVSVTEENELTI